MKVLVLGQAGREHALVRALSLSLSVEQIHCIPGSDGMRREAVCHPHISLAEHNKILDFCLVHKFDLIVIGPEQPLAEGLADKLREKGLVVFGPSAMGAKLEASKIFAKEFMLEAGIPTARSVVVTSVEEVELHIKEFQPPYVLKADGLAAGKGVFVVESKEELLSAAKTLFVDKKLGTAGEKALLEEGLRGAEISYLVLTNGREFQVLPMARDHKRLKDRDIGPNTGGMGTVAPVPVNPDLDLKIRSKIIRPWMELIQKKQIDFRGVLFVGLMLTEDGPKVLEFNTRFGDPETQVIMPLFDGDWGQTLRTIALGEVPTLRWKPMAAACIVMAAEGYPDSPKKDVVILGDTSQQTATSYFLHAGSRHQEGKWMTNGGRVLNAIGMGADIEQAVIKAYQLVSQVTWPGVQFRRDIGKKL